MSGKTSSLLGFPSNRHFIIIFIVKFIWIIGGVLALITAYFIYKEVKKSSSALPVVPQSAPISYVLQSDGLLHAEVLPAGANDTNWPYWRTDVTPVMQPLVDQLHAYQQFNLRPVYGSIGGPTDYYAFNPPTTYLYDAQNVQDFLLPQRAKYDEQKLAQIRYEQALYGNLSQNSPYNLKGPY